MKRKVTKEKSSAPEKLSKFLNNCYKIQTRILTSQNTQTANFIDAIISKFFGTAASSGYANFSNAD